MSFITSSVIIPAGGSGNRFGSKMPKQFTELVGIPIIIYTLKQFWICDNIIIASHPDWIEHLQSLVYEHSIPNVKAIVPGGKTRQESVYNALNQDVVKDSEVVLIHDAVRPFASKELIQSIMLSALEYGAAVPGLTPKDTIKQITKEYIINQTVDRNTLQMVQTPQGFRYKILRDAFEKAIENNFEGTDSSSLVEYLGHTIKVLEGEESNIKITTPLDKILSEFIINSK